MGKISLSTSGFTPTDLFGKALENSNIFTSPNSGYLCYGIMDGKKNVGNILVWKMNPKEWQIDTIWVKKECRNKGYGSQAIQLLLDKWPNIDFYLSGVKEAKDFYLRNGFEIMCFRKDTNCYDFQLVRDRKAKKSKKR